MADYYSGSIEFPASALEDVEIKKALEKEGAEFDPRLKGSNWDITVQVEKGILYLNNSQARWGMFEELEALLKCKGIPFDRESEGYADLTPELAIYRPAANGSPAQDKKFTTSGWAMVVAVQDIRDRLPQGIEAIRAYLDEKFPTYPPLSEYVKEE